MHIEGHGIHDNGREDDADMLMTRFVAELARHQQVSAAIFINGTSVKQITAVAPIAADDQPSPGE